MEILEALRGWLQEFSGLEQVQWHVDALPAQPENAGLYPLGQEVLERKTDLLGTVFCRCRQRFSLLLTLLPGQEPAARLLALQQWVQAQSAMGIAPRFGDDPAQEHIRAEKGMLKERTAAGSAVYAVTLTADFVKVFEG